MSRKNYEIINDMPYGWVSGKNQPKWHEKVYFMWLNMWRRCYGDVHYFGCQVHPKFKYFSNYVDFIENQPRFNEFKKTCCEVRWCVDKDIKQLWNKCYYPEYMTLTTQTENNEERQRRRGCDELHSKKANRKKSKPIIGISLANKSIVLMNSIRDAEKKGFNHSLIIANLKHRQNSHRGYKWLYINYKHNNIYRIKK